MYATKAVQISEYGVCLGRVSSQAVPLLWLAHHRNNEKFQTHLCDLYISSMCIVCYVKKHQNSLTPFFLYKKETTAWPEHFGQTGSEAVVTVARLPSSLSSLRLGSADAGARLWVHIHNCGLPCSCFPTHQNKASSYQTRHHIHQLDQS